MKTVFKRNVDLILIKIAVVAVLVLVMLLPIGMIQSLIEEREKNQEAVQDEISKKWGGNQLIKGPVLVIPYEEDAKENSEPVIRNIYMLPDNFRVDGNIDTEDRSRSLFKKLVYTAEMDISGRFSLSEIDKLPVHESKIRWKDAHVLVGVLYMQGIKNKVDFTVNGQSMLVEAGVEKNSAVKSGLTIRMPLDKDIQHYDYSFDLALNGSEGIYFVPVGKENNINLASSWNTVSFDGNLLPTKRDIRQDGFNATWDVYDYNRNYIQVWRGENESLNKYSLGVDLKYPVDKYQMTMRSVKYAIMFIVLTFVVFFLVELLSRKRIHPVQYLLVSCALVLFYTLLLAISEHLSFGLSYLISALSTTALITAYSSTMFRNKIQTLMMGVFLSVLYTYLFIILQQENLSLLFGAVGLFIALAIVMFVLRKVDWYKEDEEDNKEDETSGKVDEVPPVYIPHDNI